MGRWTAAARRRGVRDGVARKQARKADSVITPNTSLRSTFDWLKCLFIVTAILANALWRR